MKEIDIRRSVRNYSDKEVSKEAIEKILRAGMQAPSAGNQQAWEFIVVKNRKNLEKLSHVSKYAYSVSKSSVSIVVLGNFDYAKYEENLEQDLGAVCQNMLLEATHLGIGSLWMGIAPIKDRMKFVNDFFDLKGEHYPYAVLSFGYPHNDDSLRYVDRFLPERVHYEKL